MFSKQLLMVLCVSLFVVGCSDDGEEKTDAGTNTTTPDKGLDEGTNTTTPDEGVDEGTNTTTPDEGVDVAVDAPADGPEPDVGADTMPDADPDTMPDADPDTVVSPDGTTPSDWSVPDATYKTATIGPAGGSLTSDNGKLTLTIPPGALSGDKEFGVAEIVGPAGNFGTAYELTPSGTRFAMPATLAITYDPVDVGSTDQNSLRLATAIDSVWSGVPGASVDLGTTTVTGEIRHLSTYGVTAYGAGAVASIFIANPVGHHGPSLGDDGATMPIRAVALDADNVPLHGKTFTYESADTSKLLVDQNTGDLTSVGILPPPEIDIVRVTATETGSGIKQTADVILLRRGTPPYQVTLSATAPGFPAVDVANFVFVPGAELLYLQGPTSADNPQISDAAGYFSQYPPLSARSFYTAKLSGTGFMDTYLNGVAPQEDGQSSGAASFMYMYTEAGITTSMPNPACNGVAWDPTLAGISVMFDKSYVGNWTAYVGSPDAQVVYADPASGNTPVFDCAQPHLAISSTATANGYLMAYNIDTSSTNMIWVIYKNGNNMTGGLLRLGPASWSTVMSWVP